ncbi:MAG: FKBP-type peptidyl-prolyl cis-trans isomerase [Flavobacteriaceae bacterium]
MNIKRFLVLALIFLTIWSCKKDDGNDVVVVPPRLLSEVVVENDAEIQAFLKTHFYNYEDFEEPIDEGFDLRIRIDTIAGANADKRSLFEDAGTQVIKVSSSDLGLDAGEVDIEHTLYYIVAREGEGTSPTPVDSVYLNYQGMRLDGSVFDSRLGTPVWFDMQGSGVSGNSGVIKGFKEGMPKFKSGGEIIENGDGTFTVTGSGIGLIFMPSGIAYFSGSSLELPMPL